MPKVETLGQITSFNVAENRKPDVGQPYFTNEYLLPWLNELPGTKVLDLASGQGVESGIIAEKGYEVIAQDVSRSMLAESYFREDRVQATATHLPYQNESIDGILLKDALVFIDPTSRIRMIKEAYRVLKPNGSFLISSESTNMRVWTQDHPNSLPIRDFYDNNNEWEDILRKCNKAYDYSLYFHTKAEPLKELADQHGFETETLVKYPYNHPLATESRWIKLDGFISKLKKV